MASRLVRSRLGQAESPQGATGAAFLVLLITVLIVIYLLFLSPGDREAILSGQIPGTPSTPSGGFGHLVGTEPLSTNIGQVDYVDDEPIEHELNSFTIYTTKDAKLIKEIGGISIKNSAFDSDSAEIPFSVDRRTTDNVLLSFNVRRASGGTLLIYINGDLLYEGDIRAGSPPPIEITRDLLKDENILFFTVSRPGFEFWNTNQYDLEFIRITGDVTDDSKSFNVQRFYVAETAYEKMETGTLQFFPDCVPGSAGRITILMNGLPVFVGLPDCGLKNFFTVSKSQLQQGENKIEFVSESGSYIIDQLKLEIELGEEEYPVYYFDLDEDLFVNSQEDPRCGDIDGICPSNCEDFDDKDCCFAQSKKNLWCDVKTNNARDRCVNSVLAEFTDRCPSGYEEIDGDPAEEAEGQCGDDDDDFCPVGCSADLDKDCCYEIDGAFWCDDVPFTGRDSVCTLTVTTAECQACPSGYRDEDRDRPNCPYIEDDDDSRDEQDVKAGVDVVLEVQFTERDFKKVDFVINGNIMPVDTYNIAVYRNINPYVREGVNSIVVQPRKDVTIAEMKVVVE